MTGPKENGAAAVRAGEIELGGSEVALRADEDQDARATPARLQGSLFVQDLFEVGGGFEGMR